MNKPRLTVLVISGWLGACGVTDDQDLRSSGQPQQATDEQQMDEGQFLGASLTAPTAAPSMFFWGADGLKYNKSRHPTTGCMQLTRGSQALPIKFAGGSTCPTDYQSLLTGRFIVEHTGKRKSIYDLTGKLAPLLNQNGTALASGKRQYSDLTCSASGSGSDFSCVGTTTTATKQTFFLKYLGYVKSPEVGAKVTMSPRPDGSFWLNYDLDFNALGLDPKAISQILIFQLKTPAIGSSPAATRNISFFAVDPSTNFKTIQGHAVLSDGNIQPAELLEDFKRGTIVVGNWTQDLAQVKAVVKKPMSKAPTVGRFTPVFSQLHGKNGQMYLDFGSAAQVALVRTAAQGKPIQVLVNGVVATNGAGAALTVDLSGLPANASQVLLSDFYLSGAGLFEISLATNIGGVTTHLAEPRKVLLPSPDQGGNFAVKCDSQLSSSQCSLRFSRADQKSGVATVSRCEKIYGDFGACYLSTHSVSTAAATAHLLNFKNYSLVTTAPGVEIGGAFTNFGPDFEIVKSLP